MSLIAVNPSALDEYHDPDGSVVALCERAGLAIEEAATVADAKDIADWASTVEHAAKVRDLNHETIIVASALKIRAERRIGQLLGEAQPGRPKGGNLRNEEGFSDRQRHEYRRLAEPDDDTFDRALGEAADDAAERAGVSRRAVRQKLDEDKREACEQAEWLRSLPDDPDPDATRARGIAHRAVLSLIDGVDRLTSAVSPDELAEALATYPDRQTYVRDQIVADIRRAAETIAGYEEALR